MSGLFQNLASQVNDFMKSHENKNLEDEQQHEKEPGEQ